MCHHENYLTTINTKILGEISYKRKVFRKIFGPVRVGDGFCIRLRWLGHVVRMEEDAPARRVFDAGIY